MYCGPRKGAIVYFKKQGLPPGKHVNPADHFLDLINYDFVPTTETAKNESEEEPKPEFDEESQESPSVSHVKKSNSKEKTGKGDKNTNAGGVPEHLRRLIDNFPKSKAAQCNLDRTAKIHQDEFVENTKALDHAAKKKYATPFWYQTLVLMLRTFLVFFKNPAVYWARVVMYAMLAVMMGTLFFRINDDQQVKFFNIKGNSVPILKIQIS